MKYTLFLIGVSTIIFNMELVKFGVNTPIIDPFQKIICVFLPIHISPLLEKIAIFVDIARLLVIVVNLKEKRVETQIKNIHSLLFCITTTNIILASAIMYYFWQFYNID